MEPSLRDGRFGWLRGCAIFADQKFLSSPSKDLFAIPQACTMNRARLLIDGWRDPGGKPEVAKA